MRRGEKTIVEVDGVKYPATYIGRGKFSRTFRVGDRVVYYTKGDCAKEVLAMFGERRTHLPEIIRHNDVVVYGKHWREKDRWYVYSSPYYRDVMAKDKEAWRLINLLQRVWIDALNDRSLGTPNDKFFEFLRSRKDVPRSIVRDLEYIYEVSQNCGSEIDFDLHRKNFGVNEYGTLIFRDAVVARV
jgi:hypothetical protein